MSSKTSTRCPARSSLTRNPASSARRWSSGAVLRTRTVRCCAASHGADRIAMSRGWGTAPDVEGTVVTRSQGNSAPPARPAPPARQRACSDTNAARRVTTTVE